jgi:hypothetical protein
MTIKQVSKTLEQARSEVTGRLSKIVLEYCAIYDRTVVKVKQPNFTEDGWDELAQLIAIDQFERVGAQQEVMDWPAYRARLTEFASTAEWKGTFRRITESPGLVFLELTEELRKGDEVEVVNSVTVYEFNDDDKIRHFDCYLQKPVDGRIAVFRSKGTSGRR